MNKITVVAALIEKNGFFLLTQRLDGSLAGKWEFPGGKVEKGETEEKAIVREIYEELKISVKCENYVCNYTCYKDNQEIELKLYRCSYLSGEVVPTVHSAYVYVDKNLLLTYDLVAGDIELARFVINNL